MLSRRTIQHLSQIPCLCLATAGCSSEQAGVSSSTTAFGAGGSSNAATSTAGETQATAASTTMGTPAATASGMMAAGSGGATTAAVVASTMGATSTSAGGATTSVGTVAGSAGAGAGGASATTDVTRNTTSTGGSGMTGTDCEGGKVVHFVYFVEADATYSESQRDDVEAQAYAFQLYWYEQLGVTFYLNEPIVDVIDADHDSEWYLSTPDGIHNDERWYRLGNMKSEVYDKLGIDDFDSSHRVVNYPTTRHDGRVGGNFGGAWMDGDDLSCMAEAGGVNYPYDDGNAAHCLGHVAHEFGHVLGLDHQGPQDDCMQFGFYTGTSGGDMCDFSPENAAQILADPDNDGWLEAAPGENCRGS